MMRAKLLLLTYFCFVGYIIVTSQESISFEEFAVYETSRGEALWHPTHDWLAIQDVDTGDIVLIDIHTGMQPEILENSLVDFNLASTRNLAWSEDGQYLASGLGNRLDIWSFDVTSP
ncbi:MAG: hypothetical protein AAFQ07_19705, partial [Chloroflexota bacterium]